jgi:hypothetical protein
MELTNEEKQLLLKAGCYSNLCWYLLTHLNEWKKRYDESDYINADFMRLKLLLEKGVDSPSPETKEHATWYEIYLDYYENRCCGKCVTSKRHVVDIKFENKITEMREEFKQTRERIEKERNRKTSF